MSMRCGGAVCVRVCGARVRSVNGAGACVNGRVAQARSGGKRVVWCACAVVCVVVGKRRCVWCVCASHHEVIIQRLHRPCRYVPPGGDSSEENPGAKQVCRQTRKPSVQQ